MDFTASDSFVVVGYESKYYGKINLPKEIAKNTYQIDMYANLKILNLPVDDDAVLIVDSPFVREIQIEFPSIGHRVN